MALKFEVEDLDSLDDSVKSFYTEGDGGKYYLEVDGAVSKRKIDEFRNNNIELMKKLETFKSVDLDEYNKLKDDALNGSSLGKEEVDKLINDRVKTMKQQYETETGKLKETNGTLGKQLETLLVDSAIRQAASTNGVSGGAVDDVVLRAKSVFKVENGAAVPYDNDGVIYGKDGTSPMSANDWVKNLKKTASHLFEGSSGSGSGGSRGAKGRVDSSKMSPMQKIVAGMEDR